MKKLAIDILAAAFVTCVLFALAGAIAQADERITEADCHKLASIAEYAYLRGMLTPAS